MLHLNGPIRTAQEGKEGVDLEGRPLEFQQSTLLSDQGEEDGVPISI